MEPTSSAWRASVALGVPPHFAISIYEDTLRTAEAAIQRIRALHHPDEPCHVPTDARSITADRLITPCYCCEQEYPCSTIRALDGEQAAKPMHRIHDRGCNGIPCVCRDCECRDGEQA